MNAHLTNTIHQQLTPEKLTAFDTAFTAAEHAFDFLVGLSPQERLRLRAFGPSNEAFVPDVIEAASRNVELVPPQMSAAEISARREATVELAKRALRLETLQQRVQDTSRLAGDGCVGLALDLYHLLKRVGVSEGLDAIVARLQRRFARTSAAARQSNAGGATGGTGSGSAGGTDSSGGTGNSGTGGTGTTGGTGSSATSGTSATPAGAGSNIVNMPSAGTPPAATTAPTVAA